MGPEYDEESDVDYDDSENFTDEIEESASNSSIPPSTEEEDWD